MTTMSRTVLVLTCALALGAVARSGDAPFESSGVLRRIAFCLALETDDGGLFRIDDTGGFVEGDRVFVTGPQPAGLFPCGSQLILRIANDTIEPDFAGIGTVGRSPAGAPVLEADGGGTYALADATGLFPRLVIRMIIVGENTGALQESLENIAYFYTRDVRESIDKLQSMIEPAMTIILGSVIGWVMFSVLGPIYDLISKLKT